MKLSAAIPVYNSAETIARVIASIRAQTIAPAEVIVVDDGSTDDSGACAVQAGARLVKLGANLGRGAARARALSDSDADLVFMCDSAMEASPDFIATAMPWFEDPQVGAVFGRIVQPAPRTVADRWRGRHLFMTDMVSEPHRRANLATGVCVLRTQAVRAVGGFNPDLRAGEDADLGRRLLAVGWQVVSDPRLFASSLRHDSVREVLARYARWHWPQGLRASAWLRQLVHAVRVMAVADLRARDPLAAFLSVATPFFPTRAR